MQEKKKFNLPPLSYWHTNVTHNNIVVNHITLFISITMLCGIDNIPHIQPEGGEYSMKYC